MTVLWTCCALGRMDVSFCRCRVKFRVGRVRIRIGVSVRITVRVGMPTPEYGCSVLEECPYRNRREEQLRVAVLYMYTA